MDDSAKPGARPATAAIGLGGNLGDRLASLRSATVELASLGRVAARSSVWETEAVGPPPDYLNAAVLLETLLAPEALLDGLLAIEARAGRVRGGARDLPRVLDLDLLLYDDLVLHSDRLCLPHPRLHERAFVLEPLCEIAPALVHPLLRASVARLRDDLHRNRRVRRLSEPL